jgi:serine/threonine-protein kinase
LAFCGNVACQGWDVLRKFVDMTCPSCNSPLEPNARFCGVCGYRLAPSRRPGSSATPPVGEQPPRRPAPPSNAPPVQSQPSSPGGSQPKLSPQAKLAPQGEPLRPPAAAGQVASAAQRAAQAAQQAARAPSKPRGKSSDDVYLGQVLNNRFKVESKIGEGGFGAVYRGVQLATGRKVALKLLHPDMTKDENLVARFRREGMVLCNLRDAHTITTYDFDQTPSGTLYIAMELLEGKSLHQVFHEEAPLDWKRVFKILTEMCSSLAEAHTQGIVHRDLKPENIYLESRSGNPEFVKILDFGIAKVMRGETIDPQSPQLTATGQTLGTLEYMSPEQLMGKALDGRSDVYALGVLAYEMITGRLPFPDAKGPAGLITAQLKQTPAPPSQAAPNAKLPRAADRAILKCLEKDKNNRYPDVSALAAALQDVIAGQSAEHAAIKQAQAQAQAQPGGAAANHRGQPASIDMMETRRGDLPSSMLPPAMPPGAVPPAMQAGLAAQPGTPVPAMPPLSPLSPIAAASSPMAMSPGQMAGQMGGQMGAPMGPVAQIGPMSPMTNQSSPMAVNHNDRSSGLSPMGSQNAPQLTPPVGSPVYMATPMSPTPYPLAQGPMGYPVRRPPAPASRGPSKIVWWVIALLVFGAAGGAIAGLLLSR